MAVGVTVKGRARLVYAGIDLEINWICRDDDGDPPERLECVGCEAVWLPASPLLDEARFHFAHCAGSLDARKRREMNVRLRRAP